MNANKWDVKIFESADGVKLVADVGGPDGAPAVILLHGGGQTRHSWSGAMNALVAKGYRVINYDARGHGESDWSDVGDYALEHRVADLRAVVEGLDSEYSVVGASLGGATAVHAVAHDIAPAAVVLVDIVPHPEVTGVARVVNFMSTHMDGFDTVEQAIDAISAYNPDRPRPTDTSGIMKNLRKRDDGRFYWHWDPQIVNQSAETHHKAMLKSAQILAEQDHVPVLLVRGLRSDIVTDAGVSAFRSMMPRLEVVDVIGAGHMVAGDRNDAFNAGTIEFLARHMPLR